MADLPPAERAVVLAILATGDVAPELGPILAIHGEAAVASLVAAGLVVRWEFEGTERVTFTPQGAFEEALDVAEKVIFVEEERTINGALEHRSEPGEKPYFVSKGAAWGVKLGEDRYGVVQPPEPGKWVRLERPELVPDHRAAEPEWLVDEDGEPVKILGQTVPIDRKIKRPRRRGPKRAG